MITLLLKQQTTTARTNANDKSHANEGNSRLSNESTVDSRRLHLIANSSQNSISPVFPPYISCNPTSGYSNPG